ncbi:glycoside hydrolase [Aeromonas salmonicida]|uniref:glycoside hydrolase n=1 Tax=Aeromonas salmonicida TaxID=645 RepID=UPI003D2413B7
MFTIISFFIRNVRLWICRLSMLAYLVSLPTNALTIANEFWRVDLDPSTLAAISTLPSGKRLTISSPSPSHAVSALQQDEDSVSWVIKERGEVQVSARLQGNKLTMKLSRTSSGKLVWPRVPAEAKALLLPIQEGFRIPVDHPQWRAALANEYKGINTTEDLTLPVLGLDYGKQQLALLFLNPFNNSLTFSPEQQGIALTATHSVNRLNINAPYEVQVSLLPGGDWLAPAKAYREWLYKRGEFVPLVSKLVAVSEGKRLIGASHLYLWGERLIVPQDVKNWSILRKKIPASWLKGEKMQALQASDLAQNRYLQGVVLEGVEQALLKLHPGQTPAAFTARRQIVKETLGSALNDPASLGDSSSAKLILALKQAGLSKLWLGLPQWTNGFAAPEGIQAAKDAGYLIAPYDSYDTALPKENNKQSWLTAQLGQDTYLNCGIMQENGQRKSGFQGRGVYTNQSCIRSLMEKRVNWLQKASHYNSWFLDVAATGMVFDDFDPTKLTTQAQDAVNRMDGMAWIAKSQNLLVGSEVGGAVANRTSAFAHGTQTSGFGWRDPDMRQHKESPYFLGGWYPEHQPAYFFRQSHLKPVYQALYFDPKIRLPLFQSVFHDSIVTTHHWTVDSLKFKESRQVTEILQQLYNVPPLLNLSLDSAIVRIPYLKRLDAFFRPLHERLYNQQLVGFRWLDNAGLVQQTEFFDGTRLIANFGPATQSAGLMLMSNSVMAFLPDGQILTFSSQSD